MKVWPRFSAYCASKHSGRAFTALSAADQDALLHEMEVGAFYTGPVTSTAFFNQLIQNMREGYFADPVYGGNKDMAGWKLLGFPGARYDYRDVIGRRGEKLDLEPVSLMGRARLESCLMRRFSLCCAFDFT